MKNNTGSTLIPLLFSLMLMSAILAGALQAQINMTRNAGNVVAKTKAYYLAQTGAVLASAIVQDALATGSPVPIAYQQGSEALGFNVVIEALSGTKYRLTSTGTIKSARAIYMNFIEVPVFTASTPIPTPGPTPLPTATPTPGPTPVPTAVPVGVTLPGHCTDGRGHDNLHGNCVY